MPGIAVASTTGAASPAPSATNTASASTGGGEHCIAERRAHERRGTRGRDNRRQDPGREGAGQSGPLGEAAADTSGQPDAEFDDPGQAETHREQQIGEQRDDHRRLQLEPPADRGAAGAQRQQEPAERGEADDNARGIGEAVPALLGAMHRDRDSQQLQRQDREDARHQVQDRAAEKRQQQRLPPAGNRLAAGAAGCDGPAGGDHRGADRVAPLGSVAGAQHSTPSTLGGSVATAVGPVARVSSRSSPSEDIRGSRLGGGVDEVGLGRKERDGRVGEPASAAAGRRSVRSVPDTATASRTRPVAAGARARRRTALACAGSGAEGAAATGRASARSASPGMQISEQASQLACAADRRGPAGRRAGRFRIAGGDRDQQIDRARVAVIADVIDDKTLGGRPGDLAGGEALRQLPGDLGRQSGVAGIAPIDMPARPHFQMQRDPYGLAGRDRAALGDEARLDRILDRRRGGTALDGVATPSPTARASTNMPANAINRIGSRIPKYSPPEDGA